MSYLTRLPDRAESMTDVFRRHEHMAIGGMRNALDQLSWLMDQGEIPVDATVAESISHLKRLHRVGATGDRGWQ